ncbi:hypothetical protein EZV62_016604 [Acer yangbiense]|uniref:Uncharacterized protein n=1 Tax=Acer yangbiense TaxID=1000413 RepID=A0A5C7HPT7_9ROSI|nr:hypothetical protein EZV62_016604 [Acer yangbiense]
MASLLLGALPIIPQSRISASHSSISGASLLHSTSSLSLSATRSPSLPFVYCGRGDKKTAKGKRFNHSFGNTSTGLFSFYPESESCRASLLYKHLMIYANLRDELYY